MEAVKVRQMCIRARQGSRSARDQLLRVHLPLVTHIAGYFHRPGLFVEFGDLMQQGCLGLLHAIRKFDPNRQSRGKIVQFSTYAHYWICHCIRREIQNQGGALPSLDESEWLEDENGAAWARMVDLRDAPDAWARAWDARRQVERLLALLSPRKRRVLSERFGLAGEPGPLNQKQVGRRLGISAARVGCLERSGIHQLHTFLFPSE